MSSGHRWDAPRTRMSFTTLTWLPSGLTNSGCSTYSNSRFRPIGFKRNCPRPRKGIAISKMCILDSKSISKRNKCSKGNSWNSRTTSTTCKGSTTQPWLSWRRTFLKRRRLSNSATTRPREYPFWKIRSRNIKSIKTKVQCLLP